MLPTADKYDGYRSYNYLREGVDYQAFELCEEFGRVPEYTGLTLNTSEQERVVRLLRDCIVISLHEHPSIMTQDVNEYVQLIRSGRERTGFAGLARSGMTAVFDNFMDGTSCVTSASGWKWTDIIADLGMRFCDIAHQSYVTLAGNVGDIEAAKVNGQLAIVPGLEASTMIENELDRIDILYGFGVRQMGIAYSESNALGSGLKERRDGGLTAFGHLAVERMNRLGMAIDVSHSGDITSMDTILHSKVPVFITHAGARAVWPTNRMKPDDVLVACAERGGVVGLEAAPHTTLSREHLSHSLESVMDHFVYLVDLIGIEHVAFGPDTMYGDHVGLHNYFAKEMSIEAAQGSTKETDATPDFPRVPYVDGLENPTECFWNIAGWLVKHSYSDSEIQAVLGGNIIRSLKEIWY